MNTLIIIGVLIAGIAIYLITRKTKSDMVRNPADQAPGYKNKGDIKTPETSKPE